MVPFLIAGHIVQNISKLEFLPTLTWIICWAWEAASLKTLSWQCPESQSKNYRGANQSWHLVFVSIIKHCIKVCISTIILISHTHFIHIWKNNTTADPPASEPLHSSPSTHNHEPSKVVAWSSYIHKLLINNGHDIIILAIWVFESQICPPWLVLLRQTSQTLFWPL